MFLTPSLCHLINQQENQNDFKRMVLRRSVNICLIGSHKTLQVTDKYDQRHMVLMVLILKHTLTHIHIICLD